MQNTIQKFRQSSVVFEKPGIWKLENFDELQLSYSLNIFCWNLAHVFYLPLSTKGYVGFFYFV